MSKKAKQLTEYIKTGFANNGRDTWMEEKETNLNNEEPNHYP